MRDAWYYADRNGKVGPLSLQELREALSTLSAEHATDVLVWHKGFPDWKPAQDIEELKAEPTPLPPPLPKGFTKKRAENRSTIEPQWSKPIAPAPEHFDRGIKIILGVVGASVILIFFQSLFPNSGPEQSKVASAPHVVADINAVKPLADQGDAGAQYKLGVMYENGDGVPRDYVLAYRYFNFSTAQGNKEVQEDLARVARLMTPEQIAEAKKISPFCLFGHCVSPEQTAKGNAEEAQRLLKLAEKRKRTEAACAQFTDRMDRNTCEVYGPDLGPDAALKQLRRRQNPYGSDPERCKYLEGVYFDCAHRNGASQCKVEDDARWACASQ